MVSIGKRAWDEAARSKGPYSEKREGVTGGSKRKKREKKRKWMIK